MTGLKSQPELNGVTGKIQGWAEDKGRYEVVPRGTHGTAPGSVPVRALVVSLRPLSAVHGRSLSLLPGNVQLQPGVVCRCVRPDPHTPVPSQWPCGTTPPAPRPPSIFTQPSTHSSRPPPPLSMRTQRARSSHPPHPTATPMQQPPPPHRRIEGLASAPQYNGQWGKILEVDEDQAMALHWPLLPEEGGFIYLFFME